MLATLFNVPATTEALQEFSFANQDQHVLISQRLFQTKGLHIQIYPLDPIPLANRTFWLEIHQAAHDDFNGALGFAGNDLSDVDFNNKDQVEVWIRLHAIEHLAASNALNIP
jgi:hypothetical protein